ncbi:hypothetical protein VNO78_23412 [Psophocarpus tetragonolobus]|uniref:Uncharacterized protein n=1 Tax=Psophocarpus tetragonolobus TaxID=3891 RepID=A0AAN9XDZ8_PSOTE
MIKNKEKRSEVHAKLKHQKRLEKRTKAKVCDAALNKALKLDEEVPHLFSFSLHLIILSSSGERVPSTLEKTRELDETVCNPDDNEIIFKQNLTVACLDHHSSSSFLPSELHAIARMKKDVYGKMRRGNRVRDAK